MKFNEDDLKEIRDFANHEFLGKSIEYRYEKLFLCTCYVNSILRFLNKHGYEIVKKKENINE